MKKVLSVLLSVSLFLVLGTSVAAEVRTNNTLLAYQMIQEANEEINVMINNGKEEATKLKDQYLLDLAQLQQGKGELTSNLSKDALNDAKIEEIQSYLVQLGKKSAARSNGKGNDQKEALTEKEVNRVTELFAFEDIYFVDSHHKVYGKVTNEVLNKDYQELTIKYYQELGEIITKVSKATLSKSKETIDIVAKSNIKAKCYWVQVQFGDLEVWIDPIRIVGEN